MLAAKGTLHPLALALALALALIRNLLVLSGLGFCLLPSTIVTAGAPCPEKLELLLSEVPQSADHAWNIQTELKTEFDHVFQPIVEQKQVTSFYMTDCSRRVQERLRDLRSIQDQGTQPFRVSSRFSFRDERDLMPGDLLLSRSNALSSSFFANQGDDFGDFSHSSLVGRDERGRLFTVEASGNGLVILPWNRARPESWISQGYARWQVLRPKDADVGRRAVSVLTELARSYSSGAGSHATPERNFPFNFTNEFRSLDELTEPSTLSASSNSTLANGMPKYRMLCIEAVRFAYRIAARQLGRSEQWSIPAFLGTLTRNLALYESLGFRERDYLEIDLFQLDPRFELLAEGRDPLQVRSVKEMDEAVRATLVTLGRMPSQSPSPFARATALLFESLQGVFKYSDRYFFLKDLPPRMVEFFLMLNNRVQPVQKMLHRRWDQSVSATGRPPAPAELRMAAENALGSKIGLESPCEKALRINASDSH